MAERDRETCERIYLEGVGNVDAFEQTWVRSLFETYSEADEVSHLLYLPEEVQYSGPDVRRGMLEKRLADEIVPLGGIRIPSYATRKSDGCQTSHYSRYLIPGIDIVVSAVRDEDEVPRFADFRQQRFDPVEGMLAFMSEVIEPPRIDETAALPMLFKHGKYTVDSMIPLFGIFQVYDPDFVSIWERDIFFTQEALVQTLLNQREQQVPDDEGIPTLRLRLRARRLRGEDR